MMGGMIPYAIFSVILCLIAAPLAAQEWDGGWDAWINQPSTNRDYNDNSALEQEMERQRHDESWRLEYDARQRFNEVNRCMHTNNSAWQERCFQSLGR